MSTLPSSFYEHLPALKPHTFLSVFWACLRHTEYLVASTYFTTALSKASFLGVQPSEYQNHTNKNRIPPRTFTHHWATLPALPGIDSTAPSSVPTTAPKLLSTATKTPDVRLRSSVPAFLSVILAASAANLHPFFGFFVELLLHLFFPHSVLYSKEKIKCTFAYLLMCFLSVLHADPPSKVHLTLLASFCISVLS